MQQHDTLIEYVPYGVNPYVSPLPGTSYVIPKTREVAVIPQHPIILKHQHIHWIWNWKTREWVSTCPSWWNDSPYPSAVFRKPYIFRRFEQMRRWQLIRQSMGNKRG